MNGKVLVGNALVAALYFVVTAVVSPFSFFNIQFRLSEMFNHLIVYDRRYFFGIITGVILANLVFSPTKADLIFGVGHTAVSLIITIGISYFVKNKVTLMFINSIVFSFNMFIIAYMLKVFAGLTDGFGFLWLTLGLSEFMTMVIAIFIIKFIYKRVQFDTILKSNH